jgi:hypothetical protein
MLHQKISGISSIGGKRPKAIIAQRRIKGKLVLEDLKTISNIPSTLWDLLVNQEIIKIESTLRQSNVESTYTEDEQIQVEDTIEKKTREEGRIHEEYSMKDDCEKMRERDKTVEELKKAVQKRAND